MKIYWVNERDEDFRVENTDFYATKELAQREADKYIEREREGWEKKEKYNAELFAQREEAMVVLEEAGLNVKLPYTPPPTDFKPKVFVDEIEVIE